MRSTARDLLETYLVELMWRRKFSPSGPALRRSQTSSDTSASSSRSNCSLYSIWTFQFDLFQLVGHFNTIVMPCVRQMLLNFLLRFQCDVAVLSVLCRSFSLCFACLVTNLTMLKQISFMLSASAGTAAGYGVHMHVRLTLTYIRF